MPPIISIRDLRKQYNPPNGPVAVRDVDLEIMAGEVFSFLGPNGAGKTTTISIISGLLEPSGGEVSIDGHDISKDKTEFKKVIGVVPQEIALYPRLTARQNLRFFGQLHGLSGAELNRAIDEVLDFIDLTDRADEKVNSYSGGMKRRVNIGVGLLHKPKIVYMDEPTVGIDPQSRRRILDAVLELKRSYGMTVLYTTHYMEEAQELSDRVGIIDHGEIIAQGSVGELVQMVGEEDQLQLRVGEQTVPDSLLAAYRAEEGVTNVMQQDGEIIVTAKRGRKALPHLIMLANEHHIDIMSVAVKEPDLEAVFLHLTGRGLRE
ncbi:MAG: ABC transporter ATP-binding protein [Anaerolineae bacterium]|nr:ABC transporter ATP-binding protein [Anaerolineae bacterium]